MRLLAFILAVATFMGATPVDAAPLTPEQVSNAACRIVVPQFSGGTIMGSGMVIYEDEKHYFVMTNAHVAGRQDAALTVEFYKDGFKTKPIEAVATWVEYQRGSSIDFAIVAVEKARLGDHKPRIIPFAKLDKAKLKPGQHIYGAGCPAGKWLQYWSARVTKTTDNVVNFNMPPVGGQSGSAILATIDNETRVVGLLTWRFGATRETEYGGGSTLHRISDVMSKTAKPDVVYKARYPVYHTETGAATDNSHLAERCKRCGKPHGDHKVFIDRKTGKVSGPKYCPDVTLQPNEDFRVSTVKDNAPKPVQRPPIGDLFPDKPDNKVDEDVAKLKAELEQLRKENKALENHLDSVVDDHLRVTDELLDSESKLEKAKKDTSVLGNLIKGLKEEKKTLAEDKEKLEEENRAISKELEDLLNSFNIPYISKAVNSLFGMGLGSFLSLVLTLAASGTLVSKSWGWLRTWMIKKYGWLPVQLLEMIGKDRIKDYFDEDVKQEVKAVPMSGGYAIVKNSTTDAEKKAEYDRAVELLAGALRKVGPQKDPDDE